MNRETTIAVGAGVIAAAGITGVMLYERSKAKSATSSSPSSTTATFALSSLKLPSQATLGQPISGSVVVTNTGSAAGTLTLSGKVIAGQQVVANIASQTTPTIQPGSSVTVTFTSSALPSTQSAIGSQSLVVAIVSQQAQSVTGTIAMAGTANFGFSSVSVIGGTTPGQRLQVSATIYNNGTAAGQANLTGFINLGSALQGHMTPLTTPTIQAGASATVTMTSEGLISSTFSGQTLIVVLTIQGGSSANVSFKVGTAPSTTSTSTSSSSGSTSSSGSSGSGSSGSTSTVPPTALQTAQAQLQTILENAGCNGMSFSGDMSIQNSSGGVTVLISALQQAQAAVSYFTAHCGGTWGIYAYPSKPNVYYVLSSSQVATINNEGGGIVPWSSAVWNPPTTTTTTTTTTTATKPAICTTGVTEIQSLQTQYNSIQSQINSLQAEWTQSFLYGGAGPNATATQIEQHDAQLAAIKDQITTLQAQLTAIGGQIVSISDQMSNAGCFS